MIKKYHDPIFNAITQAGEALGVNTIAKETDLPLSTIQKYLSSQQHYFRKTTDRKWDLPEKVNADITSDSLVLAVNVLENSILLFQSQLAEVQNSVSNLLVPTNTLKTGIQNKVYPVANSSPKVESELLRIILEKVDKLPGIIKKKKDNFSDEYFKLLSNTNWLDLMLDMGNNYAKEVIEPALYDLVLGNTLELDEGVLTTIKEYQK